MKNTAYKPRSWWTFSVVKVDEGGEGQRSAMNRLKEAGVPCRKGYSSYVGFVGVEVPSTKKFRHKAFVILFGS